MDIEAAVRQQYDTFAKEYDHVKQGVDRLLPRIEIPAGASVLDVGCGCGALTFRLPEKARLARVVGVDLSSRQIEIARQRADELSLKNFEFHVGNACSLPFEAAEFDVVVSNIVLHLVPDPRIALAEMYRVLKPEGRAVLQCQKGDQVAPEMMAIFRQAWTKVLPKRPVPRLFSATTPETIGQHLQDLGIDDFTIVWTHVVQEIPAANVAGFFKFYSLVAGFWRWDVDAASAQRIEELMRRHVEETAEAESCFRNTGNILVVEFRVPGHAHVK